MFNKEENTKRIWNAAAYVRLSREDGDNEESVSIESQKSIINSFIKDDENIKLVNVYNDDGYSGTNFEREGFQRMLKDINDKKIDCVIVKDFSRFARLAGETTRYIEEEFPLKKVRFISIMDNVDSYKNPSSVSELITQFKLFMNEYYVREVSIKCRNSLTARRKAGKFIGSQAPFGYKKDPENHSKLIIDEDAAEIVKMIFSLFLDGVSMTEIAKRLNEKGCLTPSKYKLSKGIDDGRAYLYNKTLWDSTNVRRILSNEVYVGDMVQGKIRKMNFKSKKLLSVPKEDQIVVKNTHEAIISREDFDKAKLLMKLDRRVCTTSGELDIFSGFVKCGDCLRGMNKKKINNGFKDYYYFICSTFKKNGKLACTKHCIKYEHLYNAVLMSIQKMINISVCADKMIEYINNSKKRVKQSDKLENELNECYMNLGKEKDRLLQVYQDYKDDIITNEVYFKYKEKTEHTIEFLESEIEKRKLLIGELKNGLTQENSFISVFKKYENISELNRNIIIELIDRIKVYEDERIEIEFKFKDEFEILKNYIILNQHIISNNENYQKLYIAN